MMEQLRALFPYLLALFIDFYLLPMMGLDTAMAALMLLIVIPLLAFVVGVVYGLRNGFLGYLAIAAGLLFLPTVWIYYNTSALIYALLYAAVVLAGTGVGRLFYKKE